MVEIFRHIQHFHLWHRQEITIILSLRHFSGKMSDKKSKKDYFAQHYQGYRMVPFNLKVLAKFGLCSNYSFSQNFCNCSHARILVDLRSIARNVQNPYPFPDRNNQKTILFGAAHLYSLYKGVPPGSGIIKSQQQQP